MKFPSILLLIGLTLTSALPQKTSLLFTCPTLPVTTFGACCKEFTGFGTGTGCTAPFPSNFLLFHTQRARLIVPTLTNSRYPSSDYCLRSDCAISVWKLFCSWNSGLLWGGWIDCWSEFLCETIRGEVKLIMLHRIPIIVRQLLVSSLASEGHADTDR